MFIQGIRSSDITYHRDKILINLLHERTSPKNSCPVGYVATSDLAKILESLDDKGDKYNIEASLENLNKSPDSNKGLVSFSKFVVLVEINKKTEDVEILDPAGEFPNSSDMTQSQGQPSPPRVSSLYRASK